MNFVVVYKFDLSIEVHVQASAINCVHDLWEELNFTLFFLPIISTTLAHSMTVSHAKETLRNSLSRTNMAVM